MSFNITTFSTALYSTWIMVEELNLLIDAGDGVSAGLLGKSGKIKHCFITHPDRDHLTGLPQFVQLNSRGEWPKIYYPKDAGSFPALSHFLGKFDPHVQGVTWQGIADSEQIEIKKNIWVQALRNEHVAAPVGVHKSLSYKVFEVKRKLKPELQGLPQAEFKTLAAKHGQEFLTTEQRINRISFSGDTPVDDYAKWDGSEILIHEATFLHSEADGHIEARGNRHSYLEDVIRMASEINLQTLILTHFSSRYDREQIDEALRKLLNKYALTIPIHVIYPGETKRDVLKMEPFNA
ncbi:MAG TPA: RNAse Z [Cytophagales bacterium]|nr:RNAse Z [Cytophagales bacterium]HAA18281.1 RNAse Z [Cytophagales bacterium]HAP61485.1 RNAse Z [Cytophagales bacterium]